MRVPKIFALQETTRDHASRGGNPLDGNDSCFFLFRVSLEMKKSALASADFSAFYSGTPSFSNGPYFSNTSDFEILFDPLVRVQT